MPGDVQHGTRHNPRGTDPVECDDFREVGNDDGATAFINGFNMAPTAAIPNPSPMQYRISVGPPNVCDYDWPALGDPGRPVATAILQYTDHQIEIIGDVDGVAPGDIVFVLPMEYRKNTDLPIHAHDNAGNYIACRLLSTGEFIYGVP
jgi:hypothetical protein